VWCDAAVPSERDAVAEFKAAAVTYIDLIETAVKPIRKRTRPKARWDDVLADFADALSTLYSRALHLPEVWDDAWTFDGERELTDEESERRAPIYRELPRKFGSIDYYGRNFGSLCCRCLGICCGARQDGRGVRQGRAG
jgi:hypothetical protein